jgi:RecA-family ATPase
MDTRTSTASRPLAYIPADDRDIWIEIGQALHAHLGERGRDTWDTWSATCPEKYDAGDAERVWKSFGKRDGRTIASLFARAIKGGWRDHEVADEGAGDEEPAEEIKPLPLPWIKFNNWDNEPVPPQEWTVLNRIPQRQTALFSGEGAAGKSLTTLYLATAHVLGRDWLGTMPALGPAFFIDAEDDANVLHIRLASILNHFGATFKEVADNGLHIMSLAGEDAVLATMGRDGKIEPTRRYKQLLEAAGDIKPKMIGIASAANVFAGDENRRTDVQQFIGLLTRLAMAADGSVTLISHPSLTGINTGSGISGTTQWHNAVRARFYLTSIKPESGEQPDNDLREIIFKKNQYGPVSENIVLRWRDGLFLPVPGMSSLEKATAELAADNLFLKLLNQYTEQGRNLSEKISSNNYAPTEFAKEQEAKKAGIRRNHLEAAMRRLFTAGKIKISTYGPPSRPCSKLAMT